MRMILFFLLVLFIGLSALAQTSDSHQSKPIEVQRISEPPTIDGLLDEPLWQQATHRTNFLQRAPNEGADPSESTIVYVAYTPTTLYIAARCFDSHPQSIVATVMQRDNFELTQNDQFVTAIDSYNDGASGYWFSTNPLGVRVDVQFFNEGDIWEVGWNGIWECKARTDSAGWTLEMAIPFSTLRFQEGAANIMGINFFRRITRTNEGLFAPLIPLQYLNGTPNVSIAQKYLFRGISGGNNFYIKPYVLAGSQKDHVGIANSERKREWGIEARYNLADNLTANLSYNTDFAQVEVDDRQINLTRFNLFVPEKREFFLESAGTFSFGIPQTTELFFSRSIGLSQTASGSTTAVPILFGGKVTGKLGRTDIGILDVQTEEHAAIPHENFSVLRLKEGIAERSYLGMIATNRQGGAGAFNRSYGIDGLYYFSDDVGLRGFLAATHSSEGSERRFKNSTSSYFSFFKQSELTSFDFSYTDVGSMFNPGMGFLERRDIRQWSGSITVPWYNTAPILHRIAPSYFAKYVHDHVGVLQNYSHSFSISVAFRSEDELSLKLSKLYESIPVPFSIFKSIMVPSGAYSDFAGELKLTTKPGRIFSGTLVMGAGDLYGGSRKDLLAKIQWKASKHVTVAQEYSTLAISLPAGSFRTHVARSRVSFALNTNFLVNLLAQFDNATDEFGLNLRLRYIFSEGTELFVVLNSVFEEGAASRFLSFDQTRTSAMILKFTYLFDI